MGKDRRLVVDNDEQLGFCSLECSIEVQKLGLILDSPFACYVDDKEFVLFGGEISLNGTPAPLMQQAFYFFRESYGLKHLIEFDDPNYITTTYPDYTSWVKSMNDDYKQYWIGTYRTYEEAEQACLDKLISLGREQFKARQKELLTEMMRGDEELGLCDNESKYGK